MNLLFDLRVAGHRVNSRQLLRYFAGIVEFYCINSYCRIRLNVTHWKSAIGEVLKWARQLCLQRKLCCYIHHHSLAHMGCTYLYAILNEEL